MIPGLNSAFNLNGKQKNRLSGRAMENMCADPTVVFDPPNGDLTQSGLGSPCKSQPCQSGMQCCRNDDGKKVCAG